MQDNLSFNQKRKMQSIVLFVTAALVVSVVYCSQQQGHTIQNMPYHRQQTDYACGDASFEMVMHHFGADINQLAIIDVLRTSNQAGTQSYDLVRGGHFSQISSTPNYNWTLFPDVAPKRGWGERRPFGYAAFSHRTKNDTDCYVEDLIEIINNDIPVIVLTRYAVTSGGGHYRVVMGYETDASGDYVMIIHDPWDRAGEARFRKFPRQQFCALWNYQEPVKVPAQTPFSVAQLTPNDDRFPPYFAAVIYPWKVNVAFNFDQAYSISTQPGSNIIVTATIQYQCFNRFCDQNYVADDTTATIQFPDYMALTNGDSATVSIGSFAPGSTKTLQWHLYVKDTNSDKVDDQITVISYGLVSASVPPMWYNKTISSPGYEYRDLIGGQGSVHY